MSYNKERLSYLRATIEAAIPDTASPTNIWSYLGWEDAYTNDYEVAKRYGIDLRPLIAPEMSELVSIVVDGNLGFPYEANQFSWQCILDGKVPVFTGATAKARMLSVVDKTLRNQLDT